MNRGTNVKSAINLGTNVVAALIAGGAIATLVAMPDIALSQTVRSRPSSQPILPKPARSPQQSLPPQPSVQNPNAPAVLSPRAVPDRSREAAEAATPAASPATFQGSESVCYLETSDGQVINLTSLCGQRTIASPQPFVPARPNVRGISEFDNQVYGD